LSPTQNPLVNHIGQVINWQSNICSTAGCSNRETGHHGFGGSQQRLSRFSSKGRAPRTRGCALHTLASRSQKREAKFNPHVLLHPQCYVTVFRFSCFKFQFPAMFFPPPHYNRFWGLGPRHLGCLFFSLLSSVDPPQSTVCR
jgi:hypothetical protein